MKIKILVISFVLVAVSGCGEAEQNDGDFLEKGVALYSKGDYAAAELELKNAIQKNPDTADSYYYMALLNEKSRNFKAMRMNLLETVKLNPANVDARVKLAKVHLLFNDLEESLAEVKAVLSVQPDNPAAMTVKAQVLEQQGKTDEAMALVDSILSKDPEYIDALALKSVILIKKAAYDEALAVIEQGLGVDQNNISFHILKIQAHSQKNDITAVIQDYQAFSKIQPENDALKYALVRAYMKKGEKQQAEQIIRKLIQDKPDDIKAKLVLLEFLAASDQNKAFDQLQNFMISGKPSEAIQFAKWALSKNNRDLAEKILHKVIDENGEGSQQRQAAMFMLASMSFQLKDFEKSAEQVENILKINPDYVDAKVLKAGILLSKGKDAQAEELLNNILWEKPDSDKAMILLAEIFRKRGELDKANNRYLEALKINPANRQALLPIVNKAIKNKHHDYARELLQRALLVGGQNLDLMHLLVKLDFSDKKWDQAEKLIQRIKANKKGWVMGRFLTGQLLAQQNECSQAIEIYKEILSKYPWQVASLTAMAECYEQLDMRPKMLEFVDTLIKENSGNIPAYLVKSRLLVKDGRIEQATQLLKQTLQANGNIPIIYRELAMLNIKQGKTDAALDFYRQGLKRFPNDIKLLMALASFYENKQQFEKAVDLYEQVLSLDSGISIAKNNLASILLSQGTEKDIEKAVNLTLEFKQTEQPYFLDTYAWAQFKAGHINEAQSALRKVIILAPDVPVFRYHLAEIYYNQNDRSGAIMELRQALDLAKNAPFTEEELVKTRLEELLGNK